MSATAQHPTVPSLPSDIAGDGVANDHRDPRSSTRPTVPIGPPVQLILGEPFADITPLVLPSSIL